MIPDRSGDYDLIASPKPPVRYRAFRGNSNPGCVDHEFVKSAPFHHLGVARNDRDAHLFGGGVHRLHDPLEI